MKKYLLSLLLMTSLTAAAHTSGLSDSESDEEEGRKCTPTAISDVPTDEDSASGTRKASLPATGVEEARSCLGVLRFTSEGKIIDFREHADGRRKERVHKPIGGAITFKAGCVLSGTRLPKPLIMQGSSPKKLRAIFDGLAPEED